MNGLKLQMRSLVVVTCGMALILESCVYRLLPVTPPSQQRLRIASASPERFAVRLQIGDSREYNVPADGKITLDVPAYRAPCRVFLFGLVKTSGGAQPFTAKTVTVIDGAKVTRRLSLKDVSALPVDANGYAILTVGQKR